jgi:GTP:adenosylcobinamide-phosphate guanylyltransferase
MKAGKSYIRDTGHFLDKLKENALLVTADVTSLYPSIPHEDGLRALHTKLEEREDKTVSSESLIS